MVGVKKVGSRIEEKGEKVAGGAIGVGSEKDDLSGRVRLKVCKLEGKVQSFIRLFS